MWCVAKGKLFPEKTQETTQIRFLSGNLLADCDDAPTPCTICVSFVCFVVKS